MKSERRKQVAFAWMLLLVMLPFFVVKITHRHGLKEAACCISEPASVFPWEART